MAVTLQLTNGTDTVDFNDGTTLKLSSAFQMNVGAGTVNELVICGWVPGTTTDNQAAKMRVANKLFRQAQRSAREQRVDQWVWLAWKPDGQTNTQYARVLAGGFAEIGTYTIGNKQTGVWTVDVLRQGDWWDTVPNAAIGSTIVPPKADPVYNKSDADGDNWISYTAPDGDLPSLLELGVVFASGSKELMVATKTFDDSTQADLFNPHFNAGDASTSPSVSTTADTVAPDDLRLTLTAASGIVSWDIPAASFEAYMGRYQCWAWIQAKSGTGTVYVNTPARANAAVDINTDISPVYLGVVELPGVKAFPLRGTETATTITLNYTLSSASVWFYGMWLVPMDGQVMRVQSTAGLTGTDALMMNGPYNTVFTQSGTSYKVDYETPLSPTGEYLRLEPLRYTRVYFWTGRASLGDDAYHYYHNDEMTVYSLQVDRYSSLRGST